MAGHPGHGRARAGMHGAESATATIPAAVAIDSRDRRRCARRFRSGWASRGSASGSATACELGLSGDGNALEVRVPDAFFRDWIQRHYTASLLEAAEAVAGRPLQLSIRGPRRRRAAAGRCGRAGPGTRASRPRASPTVKIPMPGNPKAPLSFPTVRRAARSAAVLAARLARISPTRGTGCSTALGRRPTTSTAPARRVAPGRPSRRLEDFMTGPGNRLAHAAAREMAQSAGTAFNPLVIHGGVGLGKTHLLEAIGHALRRAHPGLNVVQLTAESFTNSFLEAMRTGTLSSFRSRFRGAGGLIVDDVHFLAAKRATQDEFLHTFNALVDKGAPIVLAADQHPRLIARLTDELVTRFLGGMVVKIEAPDLATRRAILQSRASAAAWTSPRRSSPTSPSTSAPASASWKGPCTPSSRRPC